MKQSTILRYKLFHGTDPQTAKALHNCMVDVGKGGGEFGKGFYMGTSRRLAKRRAFHTTENRIGTAREAMESNLKNTFLIEFDQQQLERSLKGYHLNRQESIDMYEEVKKNKSQRKHPLNSNPDFIKGVIVGTRRYFDVIQYKFESDPSQRALNNQNPQILLKRSLI